MMESMQIGNNQGRNLSEQIVESILIGIKQGHLKPGQKLPSEKELISFYDVSRGPVREALSTLEIMNVIEVHQGKGAFVTSLEPDILMDHLKFVFDLDNSSLISLLEARLAVEPAIAYLAAIRATDEEIEELNALIEKGYIADLQIHEHIAKASRNPMLERFVTSIGYLGELSRDKTSRIEGVKEQAHVQHTLLYEAIAKRDPDEAKEIMEEHLRYVYVSYKEYVDSNPEELDID